MYNRGAKAAMAVALRTPNRVSGLMPVDNAPVNARLQSDFGKYIRGMQHVEAEQVTKQSDADKILQGYEEVCLGFHLLSLRCYIDLTGPPHSPIPFDQPDPVRRSDDEIPRPVVDLGFFARRHG